MKIYFSDQRNRFVQHLELLKSRPVMRYDKQHLNEMVKTISIDTRAGLEAQDLEVIFDYHIFPENILVSLGQWQVEKRKIQVRDTIVQQIHFPPLRTLSQKIIIGSRISEIIDQPFRKGFSYETIQGHVEVGVSTFTLEQSSTGTFFKIHTFSAPGNLFTRLAGSRITLGFRNFCAAQALLHVKKQLEQKK